MEKVTPVLWFDHQAEEAVAFYVSLLPDSKILKVMRSPIDTPSGPAGKVLTVEFLLAGRKYMALNGGPYFQLNEAFSLQIACKDQAEVDRLWHALCEGGTPSQCGWLKDRWGLSWQVTPVRLLELITDPDSGRAQRAMAAMMEMTKIDIAALERAADAGA